MNDEIFVAAPTDPRLAATSESKNGIAILDSEKPGEYHYGHAQHSQVGTLLPMADDNGGIKGSANPFGKIVAGVEVRKVKGRLAEIPFSPNWLGTMIKGGPKMQRAVPLEVPEPSAEEPVSSAKAVADARVAADRAQRQRDLAAQVARQREAEELLASRRSPLQPLEDPDDTPPASFLPLEEQDANEQALNQLEDDMQAVATARAQAPRPAPRPAPRQPMEKQAAAFGPEQMMSMFQMMLTQAMKQSAPVHEAPSLPPPASAVPAVAATMLPSPELQAGAYGKPSPERITMTGYFGTFRGNYMHLYETADLVVLVYDLNSQVFTPPAKPDVFQLSCKDRSFNVYFAGIEFELPFAACGVQVMVRSA